MIVKDNNLKIMKLFFENPEKKFHIREAARLTGLSAPGVLKIIGRLKKEGLLNSEKGKVVENVFATKTEKFIQLKRCYNILSLFDSGLVEVLREEYEEPEAIVLFGSYSEGSDIFKSDIDIAVVTEKKSKLDLKRFERVLKRKINIYEIQIGGCDKEFLNALANGILLYGYLKVL